MVMTTTTASHDLYDPDDVGLNDSPRLKALKPKLRPTPSPPPEVDEDDQGKAVPSQGDAVLISLVGGGRASEVARASATELLPLDDETSDESEKEMEMSSETAKTGHLDGLDALAANALKLATDVATARNVLAEEAPSGEQSPHRLNEHDCSSATELLPAMTALTYTVDV